MKIEFTTICLVLFSLVGTAQKSPYGAKFSYQIEKELADEIIRPARAGMFYSLIGDYHSSTLYSEIPVSWGVDSLNLKEYSTENLQQFNI